MSRRRQKRNQEAYWAQNPGLFDLPAEQLQEAGDSELAPMDDASLEQAERVRFMSFGSGSSGNCSYIGTASCGILIDAGVDNNYVLEQLRLNSIDVATIRGVLLTHDHFDHVKFAYAILRRNKQMRLYATNKAINGLLRKHRMSRRISDYHTPIFKEFPFKVGCFTVTAFETSHDGTDNVGFFIDGCGTTFVIATDTGTITARTDAYVRQARNLMIESNYDATMLRNGHYSPHLKARVASATGHLDNEDAARYVASVAAGGLLRRVFLCHLSQDNNTPQIALSAMRTSLEAAGKPVTTDLRSADRIYLSVLPRLESSDLIVLD